MKGIIFKESLFNSVVNGTKTMTRRVIKPQPDFGKDCDDETVSMFCIGYHEEGYGVFDVNGLIKPRYKVGETLYLKEPYNDEISKYRILYKYAEPQIEGKNFWKNNMSAEYARYFIEITDVKVERLQDISDEDCLKEGIDYKGITFKGMGVWSNGLKHDFPNSKQAFAALIDSINGRGTWDSNPFVFCYEFKLVK